MFLHVHQCIGKHFQGWFSHAIRSGDFRGFVEVLQVCKYAHAASSCMFIHSVYSCTLASATGTDATTSTELLSDEPVMQPQWDDAPHFTQNEQATLSYRLLMQHHFKMAKKRHVGTAAVFFGFHFRIINIFRFIAKCYKLSVDHQHTRSRFEWL